MIVRFPNGRLLLLSKGADSVMLQQVDKNKSGFVKETNKHLKDFGEVGLRTLVVSYKQLMKKSIQNGKQSMLRHE